MADGFEDLSERIMIVEDLLHWVSCMESPPVICLGTDTGAFGIAPRPLLEIGLHVGGETRIALGPRSAVVRPGTALIVNGHFGYRGTPISGSSHTIWWVSFDVSRSSPIPGLGDAPLLVAGAVREPERLVTRYASAQRLYWQPQQQLHRNVRLKCALLQLFAEL